ncbi:magnesium transporter MgtC [Lactiplantibacillus paraplantarum]|uniref:Magnesium transporter MgtC n=1 Tax=Lactiplantibacillus paraplantarum TaxID=60520 RepID=A0ABQ0NEY7_9LACO|nr:magnesium transporter MgtC [Lactiplantibacillus paraplantarum]GEO62755.1 hypothetical protein LPA07_30760 [Lactiplantibacillus paraplantarum]
MDYWLYQLEWVLRLFVAAICGGAVGYERKVRLKTAGIRTHMLVAVGAALFMIISKYGFFDLTSHTTDISLDPSRVASQVVTGIGFIGAGAIMTINHKIDGLTTAAGLWATAAIGLAIGADMYVIGIAGNAVHSDHPNDCPPNQGAKTLPEPHHDPPASDLHWKIKRYGRPAEEIANYRQQQCPHANLGV